MAFINTANRFTVRVVCLEGSGYDTNMIKFIDRVPVLQLYVFRKVALPAVILTILLTGVLAMERILRLVEQVTNEGLPALYALELISYLFPHYLSLALPAGLLLGCLDGVRKLQERSELVVIRTFGLPVRRVLLRPIFALVVILVLIEIVAATYLRPYSRYAFRERKHQIVEKTQALNFEPGVFYELKPGLIFRAGEMLESGKRYGTVFVSSEKSEKRRFLTAEEGIFLQQERDLSLRLLNGVGFEEKLRQKDSPLVGQLQFGQLTLSVDSDFVPYPSRGVDEREMTLPELWSGQDAPEATPEAVRVELHKRLANVAILPIFGVMALPLALIGRARGARASGYLLGLLAFLVYEKTIGMAAALAAEGRISPWLGIWSVVVVMAILLVALFHHYSGDRGRSLFGAMAAYWPHSVLETPSNTGRGESSK